MASLVQKLIVEDADVSTNVLKKHVVLVNPNGTPFTGGGTAPEDATTTKAGLVKKASATNAVASADAAAATGEAPTKAEFDAVVTLCNELKAQVNDLITKAKSAGQMA